MATRALKRARAGARALLVLALLCVAAPAHAHGNANLGDFYQGLLQPFFHLEFLMSALAIALWSTQQADRAALATCVSFSLAIGLGSALALCGVGGEASSIWGPRLSMLVVGPMVAARLRLPLPVCATLAGVAGLAQGHAATAGELAQIARPILWTIGLALCAALLATYANGATQRFRAFWLEVGVRVAGSWIAAIGLLASVMAVRAAR